MFRRSPIGLSLLLLVACTVEPRDVYVEPPPFDAGTPRDAGVVDAGASCRFGEVICGPSEYCGPDGFCVPVPTGCASTSDCRPGDVCVRPLVGTSSVTPGVCGARPNGCETDADCAGRHCLGTGVCGPVADRFVVKDRQPVLVPACATSRDCGPLLVCADGECGACQDDSECPRRLACDSGACVERPSCLDDQDCYEGRVCGNQATCERAPGACTPNTNDDDASLANFLTDGAYEGFSICGSDVDWYELAVPNLEGAFVTITSSASYATLDVEVVTPDALRDATISRLDLPGVVAFAIPQVVLDGPGGEVRVFFGVSTFDRDAEYRIEIRRDRIACADVLDLYGDLDMPPFAPVNEAFDRLGCPEDVDRVRVDTLASDRLTASASWTTSSMDVDFTLTDGAGAAVTTSPNSTDNSRESVSTDLLTASGVLSVEATANDAPANGQTYTSSVSRDLGSRQAVCATPTALLLVNGMASATGSFTGGANLGRPACDPDPNCFSNCERYAPYERRDVLFRIRPPITPALLVANVVPRTTEAVRLSIGLLSTCDDDESDLACNAAALPRRPTSIEAQLEQPGDVFIMVSSDGTTEDFDFDISVLVEPITMPANDACFDATDLPATGTRLVSTYGAANDDQLRMSVPVCGAAGDGAGPDRFYRMSLGARERAAVELTGPRGGYVWAGLGCTAMTETCTTASSIAEDFSSPVAIATFEPGRDQTFYIAVDGLARDREGVYTLRTIREPELQCLNDGDCTGGLRCDDYACRPVPANDTCPGTAVTLDGNGYAQIVGSTGAANDSQAVTCAGAGAPDVVYAVTIDPGFSEVAFRITDAKFDPVLAVRPTTCAGDPGEICNDDVRFPDILLPEVRIESPSGGVYYVIVDAFAGEGTFTLEIEGTP